MRNELKRIGILTSGGDAPGMNAAIRAVVRTSLHYGIEPIGIFEGYHGLVYNSMRTLGYTDVSNIINIGGTMLYSSRCPEMMTDGGKMQAVANCKAAGIDGLVCIGGDGTFRGAQALSSFGIHCIGIPCTIDNDISCTDYCIGFDTALNTVLDFADKIRDTTMSHARCCVMEVMGRGAGYLALDAGLATGAVDIAIPERPFDFENMINKIKKARSQGRRQFIVIVAEGTKLTNKIMDTIVKETGIESRIAILAHVQRGGSPSAKDRNIASRMGYYAVKILREGKSCRVVSCQRNNIVDYDIDEALQMPKSIDYDLLNVADIISI